MPKINREEYQILKNLDDKWEWIARDDENQTYSAEVYVFEERPEREDGYWNNVSDHGYALLEEWDDLFQFIQWEDESPYNIAELIKEYENSAEHVSHVVNERVKALGKAWSESEETEVKKDKKWFVDKWTKERNKTDVHDPMYHFINEFIADVNQLDEPEVLSQEKVQIPWFVYKWIEHQKMFDFTIYDLLSLASKGKWATESMNKFINENGELFIKAWLAYPDIEVEEQKYYVLSKDRKTILLERWASGISPCAMPISEKEEGDMLTEQEIKDYDERYWAFAVKVEELEE